MTALHVAVKRYNDPALFRQVLELLMLGNCKLDLAMERIWTSFQTSYLFETPLYEAIDLGKIENALDLLRHGADVNVECPHDLTILQKACNSRSLRLVDTLLHCGIDWGREAWLDMDIRQSGINTDIGMTGGDSEGLPFVLKEDVEVYFAIMGVRYGVGRLAQICRLVIRESMRDRLYIKVKGLGLPKKLEDFIMLREL